MSILSRGLLIVQLLDRELVKGGVKLVAPLRETASGRDGAAIIVEVPQDGFDDVVELDVSLGDAAVAAGYSLAGAGVRLAILGPSRNSHQYQNETPEVTVLET